MKRWYFLLIAFAAAQITLSLLSIFTLESLADASYKRGRQVQIVAHALKTNVDPGRQIELIDSTRPAHSKADSYSAILILMVSGQQSPSGIFVIGARAMASMRCAPRRSSVRWDGS
jgi:hypothetical protein